jgi:hypothetical protein
MSDRHPKPARLPLTGFLAVACLVGSWQPTAGEMLTDTDVAVPPGEQSSANSGGMIVYIDPQTGEILPEPAPGAQPLRLSPADQNAFSTSHVGLVQVPGSVPGGGVRLDLRGRFQNPFIAVVGEEGTAAVGHFEKLPQADDKP